MIKKEFNHEMIKERFDVMDMLGEGSFGLVYKARDRRTKEIVAIKLIKQNLREGAEKVIAQEMCHFETCEAKEELIQQLVQEKQMRNYKYLLRELRIMANLKHKHLLNIKYVFLVKTVSFFEIFFVMTLLPTDLGKVILCKEIKLEEQHIKKIMFDLFSVVAYLHSNDISHRDIKPNNILIDECCEIYLCDLGLAKKIDSLGNNTELVMARSYRAPEVIYSHGTYTSMIDLWSIGCIFYELITTKQLFNVKNYLDHLKQILKFVGFPNETALQQIEDEGIRNHILTYKDKGYGGEISNLQYSNPAAIDLLKKCLQFNPQERITARDALKHFYFDENNGKDGEMEIENQINNELNFEFENQELTVIEARILILEEVNKINSQSGEKRVDVEAFKYENGIQSFQ